MAQTMRLGFLLRALFTQRCSQTEARCRCGPVGALFVVMTPGQMNDKRGMDGWGWSQTLQKTNQLPFEAIPSQDSSWVEMGPSPGCSLRLSQRSPHTTWGETLIFKTFISSSLFFCFRGSQIARIVVSKLRLADLWSRKKFHPRGMWMFQFRK